MNGGRAWRPCRHEPGQVGIRLCAGRRVTQTTQTTCSLQGLACGPRGKEPPRHDQHQKVAPSGSPAKPSGEMQGGVHDVPPKQHRGQQRQRSQLVVHGQHGAYQTLRDLMRGVFAAVDVATFFQLTLTTPALHTAAMQVRLVMQHVHHQDGYAGRSDGAQRTREAPTRKSPAQSRRRRAARQRPARGWACVRRTSSSQDPEPDR